MGGGFLFHAKWRGVGMEVPFAFYVYRREGERESDMIMLMDG